MFGENTSVNGYIHCNYFRNTRFLYNLIRLNFTGEANIQRKILGNVVEST
jgi:hypothetical protein